MQARTLPAHSLAPDHDLVGEPVDSLATMGVMKEALR